MPTPQDDGSLLDEPRGPGPGDSTTTTANMSPEEETAAPPAALMAASRQADDERRVTSPPSGSKYLHDDVPVALGTTTLAEDNVPGAAADDQQQQQQQESAARQPSHDAEDSWGNNDVEKFDGKIVYNPDGSAYIIEDSELSEEEIGDGCIVDGRGVSLPEQSQVFPQIANAFYVSRNPALYSALYGQQQQHHHQQQAALPSRHQAPEAPVMHSYRVYSVRDGKSAEDGDKESKDSGVRKQLKIPAQEATSVPVKPILMCFICKLSFGYTKSFVAHAMGDHNLVLREDEKEILSHQNASAIIQVVGKEKEPLLSFLEPVPPSRPAPEHAADREHRDLRDRDDVEAQSLVVHRRSADRSSASPQRPTPQQSPQQHRLQQHVPETSPVSLPQNGSNSSNNFLNFNHQRLMVNGLNSVMDLTRKSPVSGPASSHGRNSVSPGASPSPSPLQLANPFAPPPPSFLTGTTIGVCPDHIGGRPSGVECSKCELILSSSRLGGPLANMHSRNSCKTLKCPKCNWHYKYQETLEIHMKEKHPETETSCLYCIAGQPHPRLARGETYTCGYKPYRCEVCNYSTTTKGNLSIHMQSDKHLNNMQELQNGGVNTEMTHPALQTPPPKSGMASPSVPSQQAQQKPKPTFRCDVCNYETNVARNLRIHMTSEKHTHNMMVLQQSMKHMQTLSALQQSHQQQLSLESLLHFHPGLLPGGLPDKPPPHSDAALADMAYNQALLIQMMTGGQMPPHIPPELAPHMDMGLNPETMEPPPGPADPNPSHLFHCCVCNAFSTDSLEQLSHHLSEDRTRIREQEILAVVAGHYVCKLCSYKTNLKANFQLHCKTDKHLQRLQHVNHVKEGGPRNEWKLKYVTSPGGIQVRCHACDYYTNSAHKLQLHAAGQRHEASHLLFRHLRESEAALDLNGPAARLYHCALCGFSARARLPLLQHIRSMKHVQMEQLHQLQRRAEGKDVQTDIGEIFQVLAEPQQPFGDMDCDNKEQQQLLERERERERENRERGRESREQERERSRERDSATPQDRQGSPATEGAHQCPYCNFTAGSELRVQAHVLAHHQNEPTSPSQRDFLCPLCQDAFRDRTLLERHVMQIHSVNAEGLQRLLMLVDQSHWLNSSTRPGPGTPSSQRPTTPQTTPPGNLNSPSSVASSTGCKELQDSGSSGKLNHSDNTTGEADDQDMAEDQEDLLRCHACSKSYRAFEELCAHQTEANHLELKQTPLGPGYLCWKKGCNQYFPSATSLQMHFREIHLRGGAQPGVAVSEKHVYKYRCSQCSLAFKTMEKLQLHSQYHLIRDATKCVLCGRSFRSILALHKHVETAHPELTEEELNAYKQSLMNNPLVLAGITGPVLDPVTNELLRKESMRMDDDVLDSEESPAKENADESLVANAHNDGENSDDSIVYKEQQFLEDYLNSQAMAEDSYNDPNRKYKCHRCKVAYTRQSYLTSHNKTLLHRKGEKLTYPMEKYLDPNRPYKCDVCKESFTQKNILLVHYNSVSHLHKLKRAMQEQQNNNNNNNNTKDTLASLGVTSPQSLPPGMPLTPKSQSSSASDDDDKKPYKCNICRVAYSQGSTLDIHMRSVLHQTRASKLQDLAITGQIDLSKPLIEQPEPRSKLIQDILGASPKLAPPQSLSSSLTSPPSGGSSGTAQGSPTVPSSLGSSSASAQSSVIGSDPLACPRCSALFASQEQLATHQQLYCLFGSPMNMFGMGGASPQSSNNRTPPPFQSTPEDTFARLSVNKKSSHMYKHLLESFGFDLVMQFNENHQRRRQKEREDMEKAQLQLQEQVEHHLVPQLEPPMPMEIQEPEKVEEIEEEPKEKVVVKEEQPDEEVRPSTPSEKDQLPEVSKSTCQHCNKEFSSVWVLKAHCEEVHKDLVPLDFLEKYAQQFKSEYEKKSGPGVDSTPEKESEDSKENIMSNILTPPNDVTATPTAPSTPTASSTPASTNESTAANNSMTTALPAMAGLSPSAQGLSMNLAQQMDSMQMALNAMAVQQHLQQQLNPMMLGMMGLPLGLNMQALAAMNLQPPLVPLMMPPPPFDQIAAQNPLFSPQGQGMGDPASMLAKQQQALMQQQQQVQKRARTRITDEQLKILRAHFDINNSPSEEQIHDMAARSGLPPKVIKHWFRNTLFKERQRNKDSPYNFNNPPSTTLNLEEYEKTGEAKVTPLNTSSSSDEQKPVTKPLTPAPAPVQPAPPPPQPPKPNPSSQQQQQREREREREREQQLLQQQQMQQQIMQQQLMHQFPKPPEHIKTEPSSEHVGMEREDYHLSPTPSHASRSSSPASLTLSSLIASQLGPDPMSHSAASMLPPKLTPPNFASPTHGVAPGPMTPNSRSVSPGRSFNDPFTHLGSNSTGPGSGGGANSSGSSSSGGSTGKRANRTRFTDYQIKVLQEFFENNAYPKDDDLEYLSKLLSLSPRVIVVWFQNARQKARKVYENQPAVDPAPGTGGTTDEQGRFQRTPGLNYQCKKCLLVFQRYYELIRHQKTHCFKEEDAKRSAQAQAAAAQIAAVMSSEDSNSSTMTEQREPPAAPQSAPLASTAALTVSSGPVTPAPGSSAHTPTPSPLPDSPRDPPAPANQALSKESSFQCDKCNLVFPRFELWREHQLVHIMNPNLFPTYPPDSPFGILQQHAQLQQQQQVPQQPQLPPQLPVLPDLSMLPGAAAHPLANMLGAKRKLEDFDEPQEHSDQPKDKRLRTTILPEQLDYLYQKYQMESNPSRKMLENIAREVGLKKRVVQVWFQNTRARERKGQSRAHSQVINKRCPFCPALFKVKSALESHLNTKHADQCARGEINIDALPDEEVSMESTQSSQHSSAQPNMMPPLFPPFQSPDVEASLKKYYEESVKRYISELQAHQTSQNGKEGGPAKDDVPPHTGAPVEGGAGVLDLSKPVDLSRPLGMALSVREDPMSEHGDDSMSECTDNMDDESNPTSPASSTQSGHQRSGPTPSSAPGQPGQPANKRFRTQMSSLQVKIMKSLFADYKTPTMAECEMLGREIGLAKRVVQVWFQNARAKEKKTKLALQKALGGPESLATPPPDRAPEECVHCQFKYSHKYSIQDHIFTKKHIENVRQYLETHKDAQPGSEPAAAEFPMPQLPVPGSLPGSLPTAMPGLPGSLPGHAGTPSDNNNAPKVAPGISTLPQEDLNLLQQLYGSVAPSSAGRSFYHNNGVEGSLVTMLGLEPAALQAILDQTGPGVSSIRIVAPEEPPPHCRVLDAEAGFVCKKCRLAFSTEVALIGHQRGCCPGQVGWAVRMMSARYECRLCVGACFDKAGDARRHCESDGHRGRLPGMQPPPPPDSPSTALSHEMEDVVNQIAALAAKAAQEGTALGTATPDSNANIFCQDGSRKGPVPAPCPPTFAMPSTAL